LPFPPVDRARREHRGTLLG